MPGNNNLLQICAQLDPAYFEYLTDSQCTPEQKAYVAAVARYIRNELNNIRHELLEFADETTFC